MLNPTAAISPTAATENLPDQKAAWREATRICRRICVLREQGRQAEAGAIVAKELAEVRATLSSGGVSSEIESKMAAIFAREEDRVADAAVLAELLAPALCAATNTAAMNSVSARDMSAAPPPSAPKPIAARGGRGDIADFIDEMLAQDRAPETRRASWAP